MRMLSVELHEFDNAMLDVLRGLFVFSDFVVE